MSGAAAVGAGIEMGTVVPRRVPRPRAERFASLLFAVGELVEQMTAEAEEASPADPLYAADEAGALRGELAVASDQLALLIQSCTSMPTDAPAAAARRGSAADPPHTPPPDAAAAGAPGGDAGPPSPLAAADEEREEPLRRGAADGPGIVRGASSRAPRRSPSLSFSVARSETFQWQTSGSLHGVAAAERRAPPLIRGRRLRWLATGSAAWQVLQLGVMSVLGAVASRDAETREALSHGAQSGWAVAVLLVAGAAQLAHTAITIGVMYKIAMQVSHLTITLELLLQGWASTVLSMSGVYFLFDCVDTSAFSWPEGMWGGQRRSAELLAAPIAEQWETALRLLYFSCTSMTTTGYGDITPNKWYAVLAVLFQELVGAAYSTVIAGLAIQHLTGRVRQRQHALRAARRRYSSIPDA